MIDKYIKGKQNLEVDLTIYVHVSSTECRTTHIVKNPLKMWQCLNVGRITLTNQNYRHKEIKTLNSRTICSHLIQNVFFYKFMKHISQSGWRG
jgi:hypothetical protein